MEFDEALARLDALINYETVPRAGAIDGLTLEPMQELMSLLGDPQQAYPVIHITGTNGKGSTTRLMESLLQAMGLRVGTYTSPTSNRLSNASGSAAIRSVPTRSVRPSAPS